MIGRVTFYCALLALALGSTGCHNAPRAAPDPKVERPPPHKTETTADDSSADDSGEETSPADDSDRIRESELVRVLIVGNEWDEAMDAPGVLEIEFSSIPVYRSAHTVECPDPESRGSVHLEAAARFACTGAHFSFVQSDSETHSEKVFGWLREVMAAEHEEPSLVTVRTEDGGERTFEFRYHIRQPDQLHIYAPELEQ